MIKSILHSGLLVESDGDLIPENSKYLTAEVLLRLIPERHPTRNLLAYAASNLPVLPSFFIDGVRQGGAPPVYMQVTSPKKSFLPTIQPATATTGPFVTPAVPLAPTVTVRIFRPIFTFPIKMRNIERKATDTSSFRFFSLAFVNLLMPCCVLNRCQ